MTPQERDVIVRKIMRETLAERFTDDEFVFDPIVVVPTVDEWGPHSNGNTYLQILVVFDGDWEKIAPDWTVSMIRLIRAKLIEAGIEESPNPGFVGKSEWRSKLKRFRRLHPDVDVEPELSLAAV